MLAAVREIPLPLLDLLGNLETEGAGCLLLRGNIISKQGPNSLLVLGVTHLLKTTSL